MWMSPSRWAAAWAGSSTESRLNCLADSVPKRSIEPIAVLPSTLAFSRLTSLSLASEKVISRSEVMRADCCSRAVERRCR